jgi:hypothetical protein
MKVFCFFFSKKKCFSSFFSFLSTWAVTKKETKNFYPLVSATNHSSIACTGARDAAAGVATA